MSATKYDLQSYWFHFQTTGVEIVDAILDAVCAAGVRYHHTESWIDGDPSEIDKIQGEAEAVADKIQELTNDTIEKASEIEELKSELIELQDQIKELEYELSALEDGRP